MICGGDCGRPVRGQRASIDDAPGTVVLAAHGMCSRCYSHSRGRGMARVEATRRRQDVKAILLPVNVSPETLAAARAKVSRWFPGDTELLSMIGLAS